MTQPAHERLMTRLTALELSIQGGIHSLRSDSLSERDASALSAQLVNQLAQHRTLVEDAGRALAALQTAPVLGGSDGGSTSGGGANPPLAAAFGSDRGERERRTALDAHRQIGGELAAQVRRAQVQCATGARSDRRNRQLLGLDRAYDGVFSFFLSLRFCFSEHSSVFEWLIKILINAFIFRLCVLNSFQPSRQLRR